MSGNSIRVVARIVANPESVDQVRSILGGLVDSTRQEPGCLRYDLLQNRSDPTDFTFVEEWASDAAIDAHLTTIQIQAAITALAGLLAGAPDIRRYSLVKKA